MAPFLSFLFFLYFKYKRNLNYENKNFLVITLQICFIRSKQKTKAPGWMNEINDDKNSKNQDIMI